MYRYLLILTICLLSLQAVYGQIGKTETGIASFYHDKFVGRKTANGEIYTQDKLTAAHKTLPLGCWVRVTNLSNDSVVIVRINDRMPVYNKRSIDLTERAAEQLNFIRKGLTKVHIEVIPEPKDEPDPEPRDFTETPVPTSGLPEQIALSEDTPLLAGLTHEVDWEAIDDTRVKGKNKR